MEAIEGIERVVVVAKGESKLGKGMAAYCVVAKGAKMTEANIRSACFALLPRHAIPERTFIVSSLPSLPNGKVDRQRLIGRDDEASVAHPSEREFDGMLKG